MNLANSCEKGQAQEFAEYIGHYNRDLVITCEDKDNNILWAQIGPAMMHRWVNMLTHDHDRWQIIDSTTYDVLGHYFNAFNRSLPRFMFGKDWYFQLHNVPIIYQTVKHKCHSNDHNIVSFQGRLWPVQTIRTCEKPGHSCVRNVVSFAKFPGRDAFKAVGRGEANGVLHTERERAGDSGATSCADSRPRRAALQS